MNPCRRFATVVGLVVLASLVSAALNTATTRGQTSLGLYVVLHPRNPTRSLSRAQVKNMFTGVQSFWNGTVPVQLFTRPGATEVGRSFHANVTGMPAQRFESMWTGRQLAGQGVAPFSVGSAADLVARIARTPGGIGFVSEAERAAIPLGQAKLIPIP